jgi:hypothetical protein
MARQNSIPGWHSLRKEELITELVKLARKNALAPSGRPLPSSKAKSKTSPRAQQQIDQLKRKLASAKNLGLETDNPELEDRLVVMVRDPYWLHAFWELSPKSVERAQAALGQHWHSAKPTLRVLRMEESSSASWERDITIHGGVNNWYVDVQNPPCKFRLEIGYLAQNGSFYCLVRSNAVETPHADTCNSLDDNWTHVAQQADRIFAMSGGYSPQGTSRELQELLEERLSRPLGTPMSTRYGSGSTPDPDGQMPFAIDAEIIIYGATQRGSHVTLKGEPVKLREDGTFAVKLNLPDQRQVLPIVASSSNGMEQRTIILAVERNTKMLEPQMRDPTA